MREHPFGPVFARAQAILGFPRAGIAVGRSMELEVLGDRYELQDPIGRGGMATIYRAVDLRMGRPVAVKILREVYSSDPKFVTRFQREARAASALQHPNIIQVFDYGQSGASYYLVMEFIEGTDLRRYIKKQGMLSNERATEIAHDVALGLGAAHKLGIVHRDVKPQNVMLTNSGLVKLTDFGIASMYKDAEAERLTTTGMTLGTVQYYAPEQAQGEVVTPAADIYALGIMMYEMLTGRTPFDGDTPVAVAMRHIQDIPDPPSLLNPRIPPALERVILKCLEKDPRARYRDGDAIAYALENIARASGGRRSSGSVAAAGRAGQFAPLGPAAFGGDMPRAATASRPPRGTSRPSQPGPMELPPNGGWDDPPYTPGYERTFDDFGPNEPGISTRPSGPAAGTVRSPVASGPGGFGPPRRPGGRGKANGPLLAVIISSAVLLLGLACFLVASLTGLTAALAKVGQSPTPVPTVAMTTVPNFVGKSFAQAQADATSAHLQVTQNPVPDKSPAGTVLSQNPPPGASEPYNYTVVLTVSSGPQKIQIPDESGKPYQDALNDLQQKGFTNIVTVTQQSSVPAAEVIKTDPAAGNYAYAGDKITVYISTGPPTPTPSPSPSPTPTCTPIVPTPGDPTPTPCP
jgi:serine/threonine protein kinase